jgi:hypothetical protein
MVRVTLVLAAVMAALVAGGCASRTPQLNVLAGVVDIEDLDPGFHAAVGADTAVAWTDDRGSGLRLGGRLTFSTADGDDGPTIDDASDFDERLTDLTLFSLQFLASYRHVFGDPSDGVAGFVEPGIGIGPGVADYESVLGMQAYEEGDIATFTLNPFLRGGVVRGRATFGVEVGYQGTAILDLFGDNTEARGPYAGLFFAWGL